jgi:predicted PurR-regulated permease PerM
LEVQARTSHEAKEPLIPRLRVTPSERNRLILVTIAVLVVWWLFDQSRGALGPFVIALVLAYLMSPLVDLLSLRLPRAVSILLVYLLFILLAWGFVAWVNPIIGHQVRELAENVPDYRAAAEGWFAQFVTFYNNLPISQDVRTSIEEALNSAVGAIGTAAQTAVVGTIRAISSALGFIVGLFIIPFWLFYVLKDKARGFNAINNMLPRSWRSDVWRLLRIINGILSSYIRAQLILGLVVGVAVSIAMLVVGAPYPIILGIISGLTEIIPVIGPVLGAIPGLLLAMFHPEGWVMVLKVLAVYVGVQQLENNILVPKIQGDSVKLHPAIIMVSLVVGSQVAGFIGLVAAVPVAAMLRDVYLYMYRRLTEGYTPRQAEASVPSREDNVSAIGELTERQIALMAEHPGVQNTSDMIALVELEDPSHDAPKLPPPPPDEQQAGSRETSEAGRPS